MGEEALSLSLMFVELLNFKMVIVNLQMGLIYGCPVEDLLTGLAIQRRDWKSFYYNPERGIFGCCSNYLRCSSYSTQEVV